jgi:hypothetical protein
VRATREIADAQLAQALPENPLQLADRDPTRVLLNETGRDIQWFHDTYPYVVDTPIPPRKVSPLRRDFANSAREATQSFAESRR